MEEKISYNLKENSKGIFQQAANIFCNGFSIDKENAEVISALLMYFTNNKKFDLLALNNQPKQTFSLKKGICIIGNPGSGKTSLIDIFRLLIRNTNQKFKKFEFEQIRENISESGFEFTKSLIHENIFLDDFMLIKDTFYKGNKCTCTDWITSRHSLWMKFGTKTHLTAMDSISDIKNIHGDYISSRIEQMCNIFILGGKSDSKNRRKEKLNEPNINFTTFPKLYISEKEVQDQKEINKVKTAYKNFQENPEPIKTGIRERLGVQSSGDIAKQILRNI